MREFAAEYADQAQRDYRAFVKAVRDGHIEAVEAFRLVTTIPYLEMGRSSVTGQTAVSNRRL